MQLRWLVFSAVALSSPAYARDLMIGATGVERVERPIGPAPVRAEPSSSLPIVVIEGIDDRVQISRSEIDVREVGGTAIVRLTFVVGSSREIPRVARLSIGVPRDANVVGMSSSLGGETYHALSELAVNARDQFDRMMPQYLDPALLEWTRRTPDSERLSLSVYPVSRTDQTTVQLTITMPRFRRLLVDVDHVRIERLGGTPAEAPTDEELALAASPRMVTEQTSLYAAPPTAEGPSRSEIAHYLHASQPALRACYTGPDAERSAAEDGRLRFQIGTDGRVDAGSIAGSSSELTACVADALAAWQFHPSARAVQVSYPVPFGTSVASP